MNNKNNNEFQIPSVNERVNLILNQYSVKIHLMADLLSEHYSTFKNTGKQFFNIRLVSSLLKYLSQKDPEWISFYKNYELKEKKIREKVTEILNKMRDSSLGVPILLSISKDIFKDINLIKRYLPLFIIEDVYQKMPEEKRASVPNVLYQTYKKFEEKKDEKQFEELATRLLNKMFFSSIVVNKVNEELTHRIFDKSVLDIEKTEEYRNFHEYSQVFCIYAEEKGKFSSNPYDYHLIKKSPMLIDPCKTIFRTHLLVTNYIKNSCDDRQYIVYSFNTIPLDMKKVEESLSKTHKHLFMKIYKF